MEDSRRTGSLNQHGKTGFSEQQGRPPDIGEKGNGEKLEIRKQADSTLCINCGTHGGAPVQYRCISYLNG